MGRQSTGLQNGFLASKRPGITGSSVRTCAFTILAVLAFAPTAIGQARHARTYSESSSSVEKSSSNTTDKKKESDDVVRVETDLVTVPFRVFSKDGTPVTDIRRSEFRIFEDGVEQPIAYFAGEDQPFTVALLLDMSYSTVFKLRDIRAAADLFIGKLRTDDKVMVVAFDENVQVLCKPTNNREALQLAVQATSVGSGTSVYTAVDQVINDEFRRVSGRKAVVLLTDGVDTRSRNATARSVLRSLSETDVLVFPIQYDTYDDVLKNKSQNAPVRFDEDDKPHVIQQAAAKGEREEDYEAADTFLHDLASTTGGYLYKASSNRNLDKAFAAIADELRKTYTLGYYPGDVRKPGEMYSVKIRIYRPGLVIRARGKYLGEQSPSR